MPSRDLSTKGTSKCVVSEIRGVFRTLDPWMLMALSQQLHGMIFICSLYVTSEYIYILWFISPITMVFVGDISIITGIIIWLVVTGTMEFNVPKKIGNGMSSSQLTFTPSFFRWVGIPPNIYTHLAHCIAYDLYTC